MSKIATLKQVAANNLRVLNERMTERGITNPNARAAILAVVYKESGYLPKVELSYATTSNKRIREIFRSRLAHLNEAQLTELKKNNEKFYEAVYGYTTKVGRDNGNLKPGDGYKYRGRGYNGITFYNNYAKIGKQIGVDLINYPAFANKPEVAADIAIQYFKNAFGSNKKRVKDLYGADNMNDFKNPNDSLMAYYHANAGFGKSTEELNADPTGGLAKAKSVLSELVEYVGSNKKKVATAAGSGLVLLLGAGLLILKATNQNGSKKNN